MLWIIIIISLLAGFAGLFYAFWLGIVAAIFYGIHLYWERSHVRPSVACHDILARMMAGEEVSEEEKRMAAWHLMTSRFEDFRQGDDEMGTYYPVELNEYLLPASKMKRRFNHSYFNFGDAMWGVEKEIAYFRGCGMSDEQVCAEVAENRRVHPDDVRNVIIKQQKDAELAKKLAKKFKR